jgi:HicB family
MSIEKKSIHVRIPPDIHQRLGVMAEFHEKDVAELAAVLLEKMIVGEFHSFSVTAERMSRLGLTGKGGE